MHNRIAGELWWRWTWFLEKSFIKYSHLSQNLKQKQKRTSELNHSHLGPGLILYLLIVWISFSLGLCNIYRSIPKTTELSWHWNSWDDHTKIKRVISTAEQGARVCPLELVRWYIQAGPHWLETIASVLKAI